MKIASFLFLFITYNSLLAQENVKFDSTRISLGGKSGVFFFNENYFSVSSNDLNEIIEVVEIAKEHKKKVVVRGNAHSLNGSSVPSSESILCLTENLDSFKIINDSTLYIEAGVNLYDCNKSIVESDFRLKVLNGGGKAPSLEGFISAGGIGENGNTGFWKTVDSIFLIEDGNAVPLKLSKSDSSFIWLFGSMGQLGVIHSAYLSIMKIKDDEYEVEKFDIESFTNDKKFYWFPFFFKDETAINLIKYETNKLSKDCISSEFSVIRHSSFSKVSFENFNSPLIYDQQKDFYFFRLLAFFGSS